MRAPIHVVRWLQVAVVCGLAVALVASIAPSAGAAAKATHRTHRRHRHHHRHHHRKAHSHVKAAQQSRAVIPQQCPNADTSAMSAPTSAMRAAVVCLLNQERARRGLPPLRASAKLNRSAQGWNQWMVDNSQFTHGENFAGRISAVGYNWQMAGENIATGFGTPRQVVAAWMASTDHCRNILDPGFQDVGTGVSPAAVSNWATQPATWTNDFGLPMTENPPSHKTGPQNGCPY